MSDADAIRARLELLREVARTGDGLVPEPLLGRVQDLLARSSVRFEHGAAHTVVAIAGSTGSGKSSLFNAISGAQIARSGVRRPTTSTAEAVTFGGEPADDLLDWLRIPSRHVQPDPTLEGLVLVDLPDHDSFEAGHRAEVDRLVEVVDVFCWVVDPQKYADAALHEGYLRRFGTHGAVTLVVFNQVDRLGDGERDAAVDHLATLLADDGLEDVRVIPTSAQTGEGIDQVRSELAARVAERRALVQRIAADMDWVAGDLATAVGTADPRAVDAGGRDRLAVAFAGAVGADGLAGAAAASHRYNGNQSVGWPFIRWIGRLRPDPLKRLGLDRPAGGAVAGAPSRTNVAVDNPVARASVTTAVAELIETSAAGLPDPWRERLRRTADPGDPDLLDDLDRAVGAAAIRDARPGWWRAVNAVQLTLAAIVTVGLAWLTVLFVLRWFAIPDPPLWKWHGWPAPTLMVLGGALAGIVLGYLARLAVNAGAARERRRVGSALADSTRAVGERHVVAPLDAEIERMRRLRAVVAELQRSGTT